MSINEKIHPMSGETAARIFADGLTAKFSGNEWPYNAEFYVDDYTKSTKYLRIVKRNSPHPETKGTEFRQRSSHAFVDRETGAVYKCAGWKAPFKDKSGKPDVRFENVFDALAAADQYGGYLYKR